MKIFSRHLFAGFTLLGVTIAAARPPVDLAPTPPMGWNSWNWFNKTNINEQVVEETIEAMAASGLRDAGYIYVVIDGGWRDTKLGPNGELLPHPERFPRGIKRLADLAHARGLKLGVHTVPGTHDCRGDAIGGYGREDVHIGQFVDWGLDFVKVDRCRLADGWTEEKTKEVYMNWSRLLAQCGRDIAFSISAYEFRDWYPEACQMARTTRDIRAHIHAGGAVFDDAPAAAELRRIVEGARHHPGGTGLNTRDYLSVMTVAEINNRAAPFAGHGYWNDPDMMVVGPHGLNQEEQKAHFALWCVMSAPLMLGADVRNLTDAEKEIILNREAIAIDQDPTEQGRRVWDDDRREIWLKRLTGGRAAVLLLNRDPAAAHEITFRGADFGIAGSWRARDLWAHEDSGTFSASVTRKVGPHSAVFLLITPASTGR